MDTNASGAPLSPSRLLMLAALASGAAFLWFLLSVVMGASSAQAADDRPGPLDALGGSIGSLVSEVTTPVADLTGPALDPIAQVIEPVAQTVAPVVETLTPVVAQVTEPLEPVLAPLDDTVESVTAPLEPVIAPIAEVIRPVTDAAAPVIDAVAPVLPTVPGIVPGGSSITPGPGGDTPTSSVAAPARIDAMASVVVAGVTASTALAETARVFADATASFGAAPVFATTVATTVTGVLPDLFGSGRGHPFGPAPDPATFFSSGSGSAMGMSAVLALGLLAAHRAWVLRPRPAAESALPAPVLGTDVSPD